MPFINDETGIKLKNPAFLKFSKEALALHAEQTCFLQGEAEALKTLEVLDRYFRHLRSIERRRRHNEEWQAISKRLEEINTALTTDRKMSRQKLSKLAKEGDQLLDRMEALTRKRC